MGTLVRIDNNRNANALAFGADWSATQLSGPVVRDSLNTTPWGQVQLEFTLRYADFQGQGHAPLTEQEHASQRAAGIRSWLIFQKTTRDPDGGRARGEAYGHEALAYARSIKYEGELIVFTADSPIGSFNIDVAMEFFRGAQAVVNAAGFKCCVYGFRDIIWAAQDRGVGDVYWMCGALSNWRQGIHLYQWNNGRIYPGGVESDLCIQFESIGSERRSRGETMALLKGSDPAVWIVGATGKRHIGPEELEAHLAEGHTVHPVSDAALSSIPNIFDANTAFPTTDSNTPKEFRPFHRVIANINERVTGFVPGDIDEVALAAELQRLGVAGISAAELKSVLSNVKLVPGA